ncbi:MAG TPA: NUDIX domain-containing protein [Candidatus Saccharimonadales bacterium]|nr:NUDIX domain-containing protein [Candidatus Saccharimonadales bacterium]
MNTSQERFGLLVAVYLLLRRGDEVLLLKRANTGYQDGNYSLIAGHLDGNELATKGVVREAKEEAGITVRPKDVRLVHTDHRLDTGISPERIELYFEASEWEGEVTNAEPGKCDDLSWHNINDLPPNMVPLVRAVLSRIGEGQAYSEYAVEPI